MPAPPFSSAPSSPWQGRGRWRRQLAGRRALPAGREPVPSGACARRAGGAAKNRGCGLRATAPHRPGGSKPPPHPPSPSRSPPPCPNPCWFFVGIVAEARFKAENEVLQMLAGNSSQSLLERCSELLFGRVRAQPQQVIGILGGSVLLSPALPPGSRVKEIEWSFSAGAGATIQVAEFGPGGFERPDPHDRFKQRLEMLNATALRIRGLELGDSGVYGARIKLHPALVEDQAFNLSVYEPVPPPQIHPQLLSRSPQGCNVTLRCSLPPTSPARTSWQLGNTSGTLWEQSGDGQTLWLAIPPSALDATYTCVARSPAEERSSSVSLSALCQLEGGRQRWAICMGVLAAVGGLLSVLCCLRRRRRKAEEGAPGVAEEPQYAQVPRRGPAKEDEAPPQPSDPLRTIYSEVGASTHSLAQPQA
uniref:Ig-like domain-containing protein n=1 Tax=Cairina moschata TaxID=8855 RepID=A0A8C3BZR2_CAIMO